MAAKPFLGQFGFILIAIAALLSTTSAINATLYGSARLSYIIAKDGELPRFLEENVWNKPLEGLLITSAFTLLVANLFDLSSLSTMGSAGFLLIFAGVNLANARLSEQTKSKKTISYIGAGLCLSALVSLLWQTLTTNINHLWIFIGMIILSVGIEGSFRLFSKRSLKIN
jgi:amino acid transporter